jgi:2-phospho-L-lactate guanylyltransferase
MEIIAVPVKPFGLAKARLAQAFTNKQRSDLGRATAAHTIGVIANVAGLAWVVTGDDEVADWATDIGARVILEHSPGKGLNAAADRVVEVAGDGRWLIVHADLPLLTKHDVERAWEGIPSEGFLLAPSHDGGTSAFGGSLRPPSFAYGAGSFRRHLALTRRSPTRILSRLGFLLDLDSPSDYQTAIAHTRGSWLARETTR